MGAWGCGIFEDDTSCYALDELQDCENIAEAAETFINGLLDAADDYIECDTAQYGLTAAAVVYYLSDGNDEKFSGEYIPDGITNLREKFEGIDLTYLCGKCAAAVRAVTEDNSELKELWEENEELYGQWRSNLLELASQLERI